MIHNKIENGSMDNNIVTLDSGIIVNLGYMEKIINIVVNEILGEDSSKDIAIFTTGSSGREEEYSELDDLELMVYGLNETLEHGILEQIKNFSGKCKILLEFKDKNMPEFYQDIRNGKKTFFPSRFIDSKILFGKVLYYQDLIDIFIKNIKNTPGKEMKNWKNRIKYHFDISSTGKGSWKNEEFKIFDIEKKRLNYYKDRNKEISIKIGPLRSVQYKLTMIMLKLIRENVIDENNFNKIGKSIDNKIDFLSELGYLGDLDINRIKYLYSYFLEIHNEMTSIFHKIEPGFSELSEEEFKIFLENLEEFNDLIRKIQN